LSLTEGSLIERRKLPVCATVAETIFPFHYVLIGGFRLKFVGHFWIRQQYQPSIDDREFTERVRQTALPNPHLCFYFILLLRCRHKNTIPVIRTAATVIRAPNEFKGCL